MTEIMDRDAALAALAAQQGSNGVLAGSDGACCHLMTTQVYYEDTDFSGVVYHANYLKFAERGRSNFLRLAGVEHAHLLTLEPPLAFVVGQMSMQFLVPAKIDDVLLVETVFTRVQGARILAEQRISRDGEPLWQAKVTAAMVDLEGRPKRLPKAMAEALQAFVGAPFLTA